MSDAKQKLMAAGFPEAWLPALHQPGLADKLLGILALVQAERAEGHRIFPAQEDVFNALRKLAPSDVRVVILGQDPYHQPDQAHGYAFSVQKGIKPPPSLVNMYKAIALDDPTFVAPNHGCLLPWVQQGVLLLNTVLTVREGQAGSHQSLGWQAITHALLAYVARQSSCVFVLWGKHAHSAVKGIDLSNHLVLQGVHPSPLSAYRGFFQQRDFSKVNEALQARGEQPIDWKLS